MTLEKTFEQLFKSNAEKDAQHKYLRRTLDQGLRNNNKYNQSLSSLSALYLHRGLLQSNLFTTSTREAKKRKQRKLTRYHVQSGDYKI